MHGHEIDVLIFLASFDTTIIATVALILGYLLFKRSVDRALSALDRRLTLLDVEVKEIREKLK